MTGLLTEGAQSAVSLLATLGTLKAADLADVIHDLSSKRRVEVAAALDDEKLADVLEELPEDDQVEIVTQLETQRAAVDPGGHAAGRRGRPAQRAARGRRRRTCCG